jgi:hypothetical protein
MTASILMLLAAAAASAPQMLPPTRTEVAAQRAAIEQRFAKEQEACQKQFAVSSCVEDVRQRRHAALVPLVRREHELAAEERRARASAQTQRVHEREQAAAQDDSPRRERVIPSPHATSAARAPKALSPEEAARQRQQSENQAEGEAAKRREQRQEREERQQQRVAEHEERLKRKTKPPAAPLPVPGASAASR